MLEKVLVARTDKLGDFMLTWPALAQLRAAVPDARIDVLVGASVAEIADANPNIDHVIVDSLNAQRELSQRLRVNSYDAGVALFSSARVASVFWRSGMPYRLAPGTKLHQCFFNKRLRQRRSSSSKPEFEYNRELISRLLEDHQIRTPNPLPGPPFWRLDPMSLQETARHLNALYDIPESARLIIVHPGSGGSAQNLSVSQYAAFVDSLEAEVPLFVLVTAGPGESEKARRLADAITGHAVGVYVSVEGLVAFANVLAVSDLYISGSTGPLHIAGALNQRTVAFYPRRRSSTALRWQTINQKENQLAFSPPADADESDMAAIDVRSSAKIVSEYFLRWSGSVA